MDRRLFVRGSLAGAVSLALPFSGMTPVVAVHNPWMELADQIDKAAEELKRNTQRGEFHYIGCSQGFRKGDLSVFLSRDGVGRSRLVNPKVG